MRIGEEIAEKCDKDYFEEGFQLSRVKLNKSGKKDSDGITMGVLQYCYFFNLR